MTSTSPHDSKAQRDAEVDILAKLSDELGTLLAPRKWQLTEGVPVEVDGVDADTTVFVEVYARVGRLKGAQLHKVAKDVLKLSLIRSHEQRQDREPRLMIVFASDEAYNSVRGWVRYAATDNGIELRVVEPSAQIRDQVLTAQTEQVMVGIAQVTDTAEL